MRVFNGIAYADSSEHERRVERIEILDRLYMLVTFRGGERRVFDVEPLLAYPAFAALEDDAVFHTAKVEDGVIVWQNGDIDIGPEEVYQRSYHCPERVSSIA